MEIFSSRHSISCTGADKYEMLELNRRLESYLNHVKLLEDENQLLWGEIQAMRRKQDTGGQRKAQEEALSLARKELQNAWREKDHVELEVSNMLQEIEELNILRQKENSAQIKAKRKLEESRKALEDERRMQIWLREQGAHLEKEISLRVQLHQEDLAALKSSCAFSKPVLMAPQHSQPLNLQGLGEEYSQRAAQAWHEAASVYQTQMKKLDESLNQTRAQMTLIKQEKKESQIKVQDLAKEVESTKAKRELLEKNMVQQKQRQNQDIQYLQAHVEALEAEKLALGGQIGELLVDTRNLLKTKMSLNLEVATYRYPVLLDSESLRVNNQAANLSLRQTHSFRSPISFTEGITKSPGISTGTQAISSCLFSSPLNTTSRSITHKANLMTPTPTRSLALRTPQETLKRPQTTKEEDVIVRVEKQKLETSATISKTHLNGADSHDYRAEEEASSAVSVSEVPNDVDEPESILSRKDLQEVLKAEVKQILFSTNETAIITSLAGNHPTKESLSSNQHIEEVKSSEDGDEEEPEVSIEMAQISHAPVSAWEENETVKQEDRDVVYEQELESGDIAENCTQDIKMDSDHAELQLTGENTNTPTSLLFQEIPHLSADTSSPFEDDSEILTWADVKEDVIQFVEEESLKSAPEVERESANGTEEVEEKMEVEAEWPGIEVLEGHEFDIKVQEEENEPEQEKKVEQSKEEKLTNVEEEIMIEEEIGETFAEQKAELMMSTYEKDNLAGENAELVNLGHEITRASHSTAEESGDVEMENKKENMNIFQGDALKEECQTNEKENDHHSFFSSNMKESIWSATNIEMAATYDPNDQTETERYSYDSINPNLTMAFGEDWENLERSPPTNSKPEKDMSTSMIQTTEEEVEEQKSAPEVERESANGTEEVEEKMEVEAEWPGIEVLEGHEFDIKVQEEENETEQEKKVEQSKEEELTNVEEEMMIEEEIGETFVEQKAELMMSTYEKDNLVGENAELVMDMNEKDNLVGEKARTVIDTFNKDQLVDHNAEEEQRQSDEDESLNISASWKTDPGEADSYAQENTLADTRPLIHYKSDEETDANIPISPPGASEHIDREEEREKHEGASNWSQIIAKRFDTMEDLSEEPELGSMDDMVTDESVQTVLRESMDEESDNQNESGEMDSYDQSESDLRNNSNENSQGEDDTFPVEKQEEGSQLHDWSASLYNETREMNEQETLLTIQSNINAESIEINLADEIEDKKNTLLPEPSQEQVFAEEEVSTEIKPSDDPLYETAITEEQVCPKEEDVQSNLSVLTHADSTDEFYLHSHPESQTNTKDSDLEEPNSSEDESSNESQCSQLLSQSEMETKQLDKDSVSTMDVVSNSDPFFTGLVSGVLTKESSETCNAPQAEELENKEEQQHAVDSSSGVMGENAESLSQEWENLGHEITRAYHSTAEESGDVEMENKKENKNIFQGDALKEECQTNEKENDHHSFFSSNMKESIWSATNIEMAATYDPNDQTETERYSYDSINPNPTMAFGEDWENLERSPPTNSKPEKDMSTSIIQTTEEEVEEQKLPQTKQVQCRDGDKETAHAEDSTDEGDSWSSGEE
ncbi:hypothetical protein QTP86_030229 [Hemibagrus guttatus]|nr:hypothetical protein QTP86_030229 [Hemibagrus guttatus]